ncbi:MAG: NDP-sugar synthase [Dehalococcoidales bacterium]|nr:NDP-sugar synthase [Dehalococcoidales bacterium]
MIKYKDGNAIANYKPMVWKEVVMKAVILIGGKGTRLMPLTYNIPKATVPVLNTPFLEHFIRHLSRHKIKDIILAQGQPAKSIEDYFGDGSQLGVRLSSLTEDTPLGTAGAVKNAERHLDGTFLVLNGDIFTDLNITSMIDFHRQRKAKATIAVAQVDDPTSYGLIESNSAGRVTRFLEKPSRSEITTRMVNIGCYVIEPDVLAQIPPHTAVSIERETFPHLLARGEPVYAYPSFDYWIDIGTPEKYLQLHRDLLGGKSSQYAPISLDHVLIGEQSNIDTTAQIKGPVVIDANCSIGRHVKLIGPLVIGKGSTILEDSIIEESVIWQKARVGPQASLKSSILANNCSLHTNSIVEKAVLGDNVTVSAGCRLKVGSKIWPGTTVEPGTDQSNI